MAEHAPLAKETPRPATKMRPCLRCGDTFESAGAGERICRKCKGSNAWRNGIASVSGSGSRR